MDDELVINAPELLSGDVPVWLGVLTLPLMLALLLLPLLFTPDEFKPLDDESMPLLVLELLGLELLLTDGSVCGVAVCDDVAGLLGL